MSEFSIQIRDLGKMYRLFSNPADKVWDALGMEWLLRKKKHHTQEFWALRGLNLDIKKGERIGIIGRNGAGKSTLLKIICGNLSQTEGEIKVNGKIQALLELGTGFHPEFSGRDNIRSYLAYQGLTQHQIAAREEEIIDFAELEEFIEQPLKTYSAGMYARLAFSTATAIEPEILIIDEVLGAGDAYFSGKCVERMERLTQETGATVLFVSHDMSSVQSLCSRCVWIEHGVIKMDGEPLDIGKAYYQQVQEEENRRLRAKAQGVKKNEVISESDHVLFRFRMSNGGHPLQSHKIRRIALGKEDQVCEELIVGAPMDNDSNRDVRILASSGYMDWSKPKKDNKGYYRAYENSAGIYLHAPFELVLPLGEKLMSFSLNIESEIFPDDSDVLIEMYDGERYVTIGQLSEGSRVNSFSLDALEDSNIAVIESAAEDDKASVDEECIDSKSVITWKEPDPKIEDVHFLNGKNQVTNGIVEGDDLTVRIFYFSSKPVEAPVFAMTFYLPDGQSLIHANSALANYYINNIEGKGYVDFLFPEFAAGPCEIIMSCSIFEHLDPIKFSGQPLFYDQHDRQYRLRIWKNLDHNMNLGLLRSTFEIRTGIVK